MALSKEQWHYTIVTTEDGELDCYCIHRKGENGCTAFPDPIADVHAEEKYAALIAAAPKLLAALINLTERAAKTRREAGELTILDEWEAANAVIAEAISSAT
jgi:hypothetical protein